MTFSRSKRLIKHYDGNSRTPRMYAGFGRVGAEPKRVRVTTYLERGLVYLFLQER